MLIRLSANAEGWVPKRGKLFSESSLSFSPTIPVSPSSKAKFEKEQSGADFEKADAPDDARRAQEGHLPATGSFAGKTIGLC